MGASVLGIWAGQTDPPYQSLPRRPTKAWAHHGPIRELQQVGEGGQRQPDAFQGRGRKPEHRVGRHLRPSMTCHLAQAELKALQKHTVTKCGRDRAGHGGRAGLAVVGSRDPVFRAEAPSGQWTAADRKAGGQAGS